MAAQRRHPAEIEAAKMAEIAAGSRLALERLANHACCHPPNCGHAKFSECRNALVDAIKRETSAALKPESRHA